MISHETGPQERDETRVCNDDPVIGGVSSAGRMPQDGVVRTWSATVRCVIPNLLTFGGLLLGMRALIYAVDGHPIASAYLIMFASVVDVFDGAVARLLDATSEFGKHLDSLADAVAVGVAPGVLLYTVYFRGWGPAGILVSSGWALAVLARLAYFESTEGRDPRYFVGLPSPPASGILVGFVMFSGHVWGRFPYSGAVLGVMPVLALLMLSRIRVEKGAYFTSEALIRSWKGWLALGAILFATVLPWAAMFVVYSALVVLVVSGEARRRLRARRVFAPPLRPGQVDGVAAGSEQGRDPDE